MLYLAKGYKIISISVCDFGRFVIVLCVSSLVKLKLRLQPAALPAGGGNSQFETWTLRKLASLRKLLLLWSKLCTTSLVTKAKVMQEMPINPRKLFSKYSKHKLITATPNICVISYIICWIFKHGNCNLKTSFTKTLPTLSPFLLGRKRRKVKVNWQNNLEYICGNIHYLKEKKIPHQSGLFNNNRSEGEVNHGQLHIAPVSKNRTNWKNNSLTTHMSYSTLAHHCLLSIDVFRYWCFAIEILNSW